MPNLELIDRTETWDGKKIGAYALDHSNGEICFVRWTVLYRKHQSYAFSAELLDGLDAEKIYVVDKNSANVYLFTKNQYQEGEMVKENGEFQYTLGRDKAIQSWGSLDSVLE